MDGTLLNSKEKISEENKKVIEMAQAKGVEVVIATGRSYKEARHALDAAELKCSVISLNGAVVWDEEGNVVVSNPIGLDDFKKARKLLDEYNLHYEIYTNEGTYTYSKDQSVASLIDILVSAMPEINPLYIAEKANERFELDLVTLIDDYDQLYNIPDIEFYKLLVYSGNIPLLEEFGGKLKQQTPLAISSSGPGNLEITSIDAQKGKALSDFVAERKIDLSDTMAIGDSFNDISMFEKVGKPIAMGNAPVEIKQLCGEETLSNNENGVAKAIWKALNDK